MSKTFESVTVADGKYTVINDSGNLTALRNGEPWERDLTGDQLVYSLVMEILRLKEIMSTCDQESDFVPVPLDELAEPKRSYFSFTNL